MFTMMNAQSFDYRPLDSGLLGFTLLKDFENFLFYANCFTLDLTWQL